MRIFLTPQLFDNKIPSWYEYIEGENEKSIPPEESREEK